LKAIFLGSWVLGKRKVHLLLLRPNPGDLDHIRYLFEAGKVVPIIDKQYPLSDVADAFRYFAEGNTKGKIVVNVQ
jgi:NADPH:quinone reductase-like Zn-dependent oxidoreductase